jgi:hypothetical protein
MFLQRGIQILLANIFAATNLKKLKDDYSGRFVEISEKVQSGVSWARNLVQLLF